MWPDFRKGVYKGSYSDSMTWTMYKLPGNRMCFKTVLMGSCTIYGLRHTWISWDHILLGYDKTQKQVVNAIKATVKSDKTTWTPTTGYIMKGWPHNSFISLYWKVYCMVYQTVRYSTRIGAIVAPTAKNANSKNHLTYFIQQSYFICCV